ncbi:unnamed protein product [Adineta ricciae]|uniref:Bis(5'-nucleosyl)-tetraphosphatase [asymmetrical] n=1 Tax=Adineta ricciae TaxID=249248 RepID=A0A815SKD6_ADIRI|nr:unnamed protein product [Adineta ricciae]
MTSAAGFIIFRQLVGKPIQYLLLQTSYGEHHWTPPKGHLDAGESPLQAAERETKEEAGLTRNDFECYEKFEEKTTYDVKGKPKDVYYYLACLRNPEQSISLSDEHQALSWSNLQEACDLMDITSMLDRICASNVVIASQQRDEPDFTQEQKYHILQQLYSTNPATFIYRFGSLLTDDDLQRFFDPNADYIRQIATPQRHKQRANRRYTYMQQLVANGSYFSDEAMKERSPLLYEQMIGRYEINDTNKQLVTRTANGPLADFYMEHLEAINHQERVEEEFQKEQQTRREEDSESEEDEDDNECPNAQRELYRKEFLAIQKEKFLNGEDSNIDYASIDNNENLDDIKIRERDEEEGYFDDEDSYTYGDDKR